MESTKFMMLNKGFLSSLEPIDPSDIQKFMDNHKLPATISHTRNDQFDPTEAQNLLLSGIESEPAVSGAVYILLSNDGEKYCGTPIHREIVGDDRPDLHFVFFGEFSTDLSSPDHKFHMSNYHKGDQIYVTEMERNPACQPEDRITSFKDMPDVANHKEFWRVKTCYLVVRSPLPGNPQTVKSSPNPGKRSEEMARKGISIEPSRRRKVASSRDVSHRAGSSSKK